MQALLHCNILADSWREVSSWWRWCSPGPWAHSHVRAMPRGIQGVTKCWRLLQIPPITPAKRRLGLHVCCVQYNNQVMPSLLIWYSFRCCNQKSRNYDSANLIPGCKKGKHCSEHHENYPYAAYTTFMMDTVELFVCVCVCARACVRVSVHACTCVTSVCVCVCVCCGY